MRAKLPIRPELIPVSVEKKKLGIFLIPLNRKLVHRRVTHNNKFAGTYTWVERGTERIKCLVQEHNTMSPARAWA